MERYIALPVAAAAYPQNYVGKQIALLHVVDTQQDFAPLCSRVKPGSILRDMALLQPADAATCAACQAQLTTERQRTTHV